MNKDFKILAEGGLVWQAMMLVNQTDARDFFSLIEQPTTVQAWDKKEPFNFILLGRRTFTAPSIDEQASFDKQYPYGKRIDEVSSPPIFPQIIWWGSISFTEYNLTDAPSNNDRIRIVSQDLFDLLSDFILPPHSFYPIQIQHEVSKEVRKYYIFHLLCDPWWNQSNALWSLMTPQIVNSGSHEILINYQKGQNGDYQSFTALVDEDLERFPEGEEYYSNYVFEKAYDLLSINNKIYISEKLTNAIEKVNPELILSPNEDDDFIITGYQE